MTRNEEIYNALVLLQNECKRSCDGKEYCKKCYIKKSIGRCPFLSGFIDAEIKKPSLFTDIDTLWESSENMFRPMKS